MTPLREEWMARAVELSRQGFPAPNPHVGCVIERDGKIVGEGYHDHAGGPHAEIVALNDAGLKAQGATAYVTMEPCNHHGRTGPCSEALIAAGVTRVVIATPDPNPRGAGGAARLRAAGVEVIEGMLTEAAEKANRMWRTAFAMGRPFVVAKAATSLDGRIALPSGESQWITGETARRQAHVLRADCGAVLVGRKTVEMDDPSLTVRHIEVVNQPVRIVLDPSSRLEGTYKIFDSTAQTVQVVHAQTQVGQLACKAVEGHFDLRQLLVELFALGMTSLLVEGGARTLAAFLRAGLVDRLELFVAPKVLGDGPSWVEGLQAKGLEHVPGFVFVETRMLGRDLWITAEPLATNR